jgi:hypothetical protein
MPDGTSPRPIRTLRDVLDAAQPRPPDVADNPADRHRLSEEKRTYATRFADKMAICIANGLRERFPGVLPDEEGGDPRNSTSTTAPLSSAWALVSR